MTLNYNTKHGKGFMMHVYPLLLHTLYITNIMTLKNERMRTIMKNGTETI